MGVVKAAVGCAVVALLAGGVLAQLSPAQQRDLLSSARAIMVGSPVPASVGAPRRLVASGAALDTTSTHSEQASSARETIEPDRSGQYEAEVEIDGQRLPVMIDTGATFLTLSYEDAQRLGIRLMPSDYAYKASTANGISMVGKVQLPRVTLGSITVRDVPALVCGRGQLVQSLLGMSFLSRLSSLSVDHGRLALAQ